MRKPPMERAAIKSVSMPLRLLDQATERCRGQQYPTFSDYVQTLIRADLANVPAKAQSQNLAA